MSVISAVGWFLKLIGFADAAERLIERWQAKNEGRAAQKLDDTTATQKIEQEAADARARASTDSDYADMLRHKYTDRS